jgi:hypothetical protein
VHSKTGQHSQATQEPGEPQQATPSLDSRLAEKAPYPSRLEASYVLENMIDGAVLIGVLLFNLIIVNTEIHLIDARLTIEFDDGCLSLV